MKSINLFLLAFMLFFSNLNAQNINPFALNEDSLYASYPFAILDTHLLRSTNLLLHKYPMGLQWQSFKGNSEDSAAGLGHRFQALLDARQIALDTNQFPNYQELIEREKWVRTNLNANPILLHLIEYDAINDSAVADSSIFLNTNGYFEHQGSSSPFIKQSFFSLTGNYQNLATYDTLTFVIHDTLLFNNVANQIVSLKIDLKDGQGLRSITLNQPFNTIYSEAHRGTSVVWQLEAELDNGQIYYAKLLVSISNVNCNPPAVSPGPWGGVDKVALNGNSIHWDYQYPLNLTEAWNAKKAEGNTYVWYRKTVAPGEENKFRKPIIIVEGIDFGGKKPGDGRRPNESTHMGDAGWQTLWNCDQDYPFQEFPDFLNALHEAEYDIILLDFHNGVDHIQRNGLLLSSIIQSVNNYKIGNEQNVVLGASMGGQVARYALTYMEYNKVDHCTGLFASLDSPWKGAHIPLSIQWFVNTAAAWEDADGKRLKANIHSPAAKQMLRFHYWANRGTKTYNGGQYQHTIIYNPGTGLAPDPNYYNFQNEVAAIGDFPKKCRNIALVNGNISNTKTFSTNGQQYVEFTRNIYCSSLIFSLSLKIEANLFAVGANNGTILEADRPGKAREVVKVFGAKNLDNVPGSLRRDIKTEVSPAIQQGVWNGIASNSFWLNGGSCSSWSPPTLMQEYSSFVPTFSALNINTTNLFNYNYSNLPENYANKGDETHFDAYHASIISTGHVQGTVANLNWLKNQIYDASVERANPGGGKLSYQWNLPLASIAVPSLDIENGGVLLVNANQPRYDLPNIQSNFDVQGGLAKVFLGGTCVSNNILNINSGGTLVLGDQHNSSNGNNNVAFLHLDAGAQLNLNSGGNLIIHPGSKIYIQNGGTLKLADNVVLNNAEIIVEEGGELIYESAANLSFNQYGSSLLIQGKLTVKSGAIISVNSSGKIIFDQDIPWITNPTTGNPMRDIASYLDIEAGAKLRLVGTDPSFKNQTLLEIRKETIFKDADQDIFDEVLIQNGALEIAPQAFLFVASPLSIIDAEIRSTDPQNFHDGLRIWNGNTINYLRRVNIKNGHPGVLVSGLGSRGHTEFRDCNIELNWDGLKWNGGFHKVLNCTFNSNLRHAIYGQNLNGTSEIFNSNFNFLPLSGISPSGSAIDLQGQEGSLLQASGNTINGFAHGINLDDMDLRAECNTIQNNYTGIKSNNAIVYLNNEASNTIKQNQSAGINLIGDESGGSGIYLLEGNNKFQFPSSNLSTYNHVLGLWNCNQPLSDYTPTMYMDFNYNQFDIPANATVASLFSLSVVSCNNPSTYFAFNADLSQNNNSAPTCGNSVVIDFHPALATLSELPPTFGKVSNGSAFAETPLYQALDQALNKLSFDEYIRDDQDALNDLILILQGTITNSDAHTQAYLNLAYRAMHQALNQAYQQNQLINNEGEPNPPISEIADVCGIADDWLLLLNPADSMDHASIFQLNLDKVHAYRVAGNYDEALAVLTNRVNWNFNFTQTQRASYWNCVCQQEKAYFNEEIPAEEFEYGIAQCQSTYAGYTYKRAINPTLIEETLEDKLTAYPQPVSRNLYLEKDLEFDLETTFKVYSLSGAALELKGASISGNKVNLDLSNLKLGVYILKVQSTNFNQTLRILKK